MSIVIVLLEYKFNKIEGDRAETELRSCVKVEVDVLGSRP